MLTIVLVLFWVSATLATRALLAGAPAPSLVPRRPRPADGFDGRAPGVRLLKLLYPAIVRVAPVGDVVTSPVVRAWLSAAIKRAGLRHGFTVNQAIGASLLLGVVTPVVALALGFRSPSLLTVLTGAGAGLPVLVLRDLARQRQHDIVRRLPGTVDVLSLSVEAGLDFLIAVRRVVERGEPSALRDELATMLQDVRLGQTRVEALKAMALRTETPEVTEFCAVLVQADLVGASIGSTLKALASRMRTDRFQRAEKAGARAAHKMRLPLMVFIFPAVLLLILAIALGPAVVQLMYHGGRS